MSKPPKEAGPGDNLKGYNPEKLLIIEIEQIHPLLELQYVELAKRGEALLNRAVALTKEHIEDGTVVIKDDATTNAFSDLYSQLRDYAGDDGEVEETRKKVKLLPYKAAQSIDAWFKTRRERLVGAMAVIDMAQNAYVTAKRIADERRIKEAFLKAKAEADKLAAAAAKADAPADVIEKAMEAEMASDEAAAETTKSVADLTRTRSTMGVTTSQTEKWTYTLKDIRTLCKAIVTGDAPETLVTVNDSAIKLLIRGRNGRHSVPGLEIFPDYKINRRGA